MSYIYGCFLNFKSIIMKNNKTYYGTLEKSETLRPIIIPDGLDVVVYESLSPFWGYYDDYPGKHNDHAYYYLLLSERSSFTQVHRWLLDAQRELSFKVDMDLAMLTFDYHQYYSIRLRYVDNLQQVVEIQQLLQSFKAPFLVGKAKEETHCLTKVIKYFELEKIGEGLWLDQRVKNHGYVQLPVALGMQDFKAFLKRVRNNWQGNSFDAGLGVLTTSKEVIDVVRVYSKSIRDEHYLEELKAVLLANL